MSWCCIADMDLRRRLYVDPEVQFPLILALILIVTGEGLFVGWGLMKAVAAAKDWQNPDQAKRFFFVLAATIIPVVAANFILGAWLSNKIAGPLLRLRQTIAEIARGNLEVSVALRQGDFLQAHAGEMNRMIETLRRLLYRDRGHAVEADELLDDCLKRLDKAKGVPEAVARDLRERIADAKSRLSIINHHFLKGKAESAREEAP